MSYGQGVAEKGKDVKLVNWQANPCDNTYDPYRVGSRITAIAKQGNITLLTVSFSDNCCANFEPRITFQDKKLMLSPYEEESFSLCGCQCCFSIAFEIANLPADGYETYFHGEKIERTDDPYKIFEPRSELYKGDTINRLNRYRIPEGIWMTFYDHGSIEEIKQYPKIAHNEAHEPLWEKAFHPAGELAYFSRNDTSESWFSDGTFQAKGVEYEIGDTTYEKFYSVHKNQQVRSQSLEKRYPKPGRSKFDPDYKTRGSITEILYKEEFSEDGRLKVQYRSDTTYSLNESGKVVFLEFNGGTVAYNVNGSVSQRIFYWDTKGPAGKRELENALSVTYGRNGKVEEVHYSREEADQERVRTGYYDWAWNKAGKLIQSPEKWKEALPWAQFNQLRIP
jgi:hypothetical protein